MGRFSVAQLAAAGSFDSYTRFELDHVRGPAGARMPSLYSAPRMNEQRPASLACDPKGSSIRRNCLNLARFNTAPRADLDVSGARDTVRSAMKEGVFRLAGTVLYEAAVVAVIC